MAAQESYIYVLIQIMLMEAKYNASTEARPEGDRVLDAPLVRMDIADFIRQIKKEAT